MRSIARSIAVAALGASAIFAAPVQADEPMRPGCGADQVPVVAGPDQCFPWQGEWRRAEVSVPSRIDGAADYEGYMLAPVDVGTDLPVVVLQHGYQGSAAGMHWTARDLAGNGYVVIAVTSPSSGDTASAEAFSLAVQSAIDFLHSPANPYAAEVDLDRLGAAGHSQGALAVAHAQMVDQRIDVIVAFDNLSSDVMGDEGSAINCRESGLGLPTRAQVESVPITPRVPAFGQAQDLPCVRAPDEFDPEAKKSGYRVWRDAGVESLLVSFAGYDHLEWSQSFADSARVVVRGDDGVADHYEYLATLTRLWLDHYLRGADTIPQLLSMVPAEVRSDRWTSAAFVGGLDCEDLSDCEGFPG